jgi:hypothetical protein
MNTKVSSGGCDVARVGGKSALAGLGLVALLLSGAAGCASTPQLSPHVARKMVDLRQDLVVGKTKIDSTTATLSDIMKNPRLNTERQIAFFQKEMGEMEQVAQRIRDTHTQMQAKSDQYLQEWDKELGQIQNKEIASAGAQRKEVSAKAVDGVRQKLEDAKQVLAPFMSNMRDISRYFKQDQTADAVAAVKPVIQKTLSQKQEALRQLDAVIAEIDRITKSVE